MRLYTQWKPDERSLRYCMVEPVPEKCQLHFSFLTVGLVIASNLVKIIGVATMLTKCEKHNAPVTLRDALASFLELPGSHTRSRCPQNFAEIKRRWSGDRREQSKLIKRQ
jgi:hypothetical protein